MNLYLQHRRVEIDNSPETWIQAQIDKGTTRYSRVLRDKIASKLGSIGMAHGFSVILAENDGFILKKADFSVYIRARHLRPGGGAQDEQFREHFAWLQSRENCENTSCGAFLDGLYANDISAHMEKLRDIEAILEENPAAFWSKRQDLQNLSLILHKRHFYGHIDTGITTFRKRYRANKH